MSDNKKHILIVEDEILIASQIKISLTKHGYNCAGIAINYNAAKAILKIKAVDLVLIDINLSGDKTGFDIAEFINKHFGIPFLFLTSYKDSKTLEEIKKLNPAGYMNKPINEATLLTNLDILFHNTKDKENTFITITIGTATYNINVSKLLYVESDHVYIRLHFTSKKILLRSTLKSFLSLLPKDSLLQISRGIAINPNFIEKIESSKVIIANISLRLSKNYKENLNTIK
jgi:DNA-binding LytR/AlgR family response regulator